MGRTGTLWGIEHSGVVPDLITVGKSLASGMPLAGVIGSTEVMDSVHPGGLGSTYGGNPVACAAAVESLKAISDPDFLARAVEVGERIHARLNDMASRHPAIGEVRGIGPMAAIELVKDRETREPAADIAAATVAAALERGLVILKTGIYDNVIRDPGPDRRARRGPRGRPRPARGVAWSSSSLTHPGPRRSVSAASGRPTATSSPSTGSSLDVVDGEFFSMLGPSGSGKTTTLRMIAGFELPTEGEVLLNGADVSRLPPYQRDVNTVFQDYALFPHMSVGDNVGYGLMVRRVGKA